MAGETIFYLLVALYFIRIAANEIDVYSDKRRRDTMRKHIDNQAKTIADLKQKYSTLSAHAVELERTQSRLITNNYK
jgi:septal ring factor EnvC (AmiA/AmiB activator)